MAHMGEEKKCVQGFGCKKVKGGDDLKDLGVGGRIILKFILNIQDGKACTGFVLLKVETSGGHFWVW
jgi:hypothetical protein